MQTKLLEVLHFLKPLKTNLGPNVLRPREQQLKATFVVCHIKNNAKNNQQLLSSIINNLERRPLTTRSSNEKAWTTPFPDRDSHQKDYKTLLSELKVLDSKSWPSNKSVGYSESEIEKLCARFRLNVNKILQGLSRKQFCYTKRVHSTDELLNPYSVQFIRMRVWF
ncbi:hypothetical protein AVEN_6588-1 [Araneus ventricosus]|uniref:Uncharacterized protein n=1 Tax=Araneus ventricosus TaxID=182803 RepID=A0A4Y2LMF1_ARAVE|nr:hypothetical protein AVEN_6588-1 [Araneus ventricosus]